MNLTTAFTIFVKQAIREQGIPFEITRETLNGEILAAFKEVEEIEEKSTLAVAILHSWTKNSIATGNFLSKPILPFTNS